jgi:hypothetical protein
MFLFLILRVVSRTDQPEGIDRAKLVGMSQWHCEEGPVIGRGISSALARDREDWV